MGSLSTPPHSSRTDGTDTGPEGDHMIRRNKRPAQAKGSEPFTYVHRGTTITGDLEASGRVRVHGAVRGNIRVSGVLEVAESGVIEGELIEADEVKIIGTVVANVHAKGKIEIWKDGRLEGDVRATSLDIEEGASFTGRSEMNAAAPKPARLPASISDDDEAGSDGFGRFEQDQDPALS